MATFLRSLSTARFCVPIIKQRQIQLLMLLSLHLAISACQQPQSAVTPPSACSSSKPLATLEPTPSPFLRTEPAPDIQSLTEADVVKKQERLSIQQAWISPDSQKLAYLLQREQRVQFKQEISASQTNYEAWIYHQTSGHHSQLTFKNPSSENRLLWLNNQSLLLAEKTEPNRWRLVLHELTSGKQRVLSESARSFSSRPDQNGWFTFINQPGTLESIQLSSGNSKQHTLTDSFADKITQVETLSDGRLLLFEDHTPAFVRIDHVCVGGACRYNSARINVSIFDPDTDQKKPIPAFQDGAYHPENLLLSRDQRHLAWADESNLILVELASQNQKLHLPDTEMIAWLSDEHILLRREAHLEVYDISRQQPLAQHPLKTEVLYCNQPLAEPTLQAVESPIYYDSNTHQALISMVSILWYLPVLKTWNLNNPSQPEPLQTLPDQGDFFPLGMLERTAKRPPLLFENRPQQPLRVFRLKPKGTGLEKLFELPYNPKPDFRFEPESAQGPTAWKPLFEPLF